MDPETYNQSLKCIRCGICADVCPTYRLTRNESMSPRGRVYLMRAYQEGRSDLGPSLLARLDACLGCRACEAACPSAVPFGRIVDGFRSHMEAQRVRPPLQRLVRSQLLDTLTSPARMQAALRVSQASGITGELPRPLAYLLAGDGSDTVTLPVSAADPSPIRVPAFSPAIAPRRARVAVLEGCVMRVLFGRINQATVRVLQLNGCDVVAPPSLGCCGALDHHAGRLDEARAKARSFIDVLSSVQFDALVVNSAGCGSTLREYGHLLADDAAYSARATELAGRTRDISEFLIEMGIVPPMAPVDRVVAYHDACHLAHAQRIRTAPRALLAAIPGLRTVELPESDLCCGSAGTYNLTQPRMARRLMERKVDHILATGANTVATGNPGCLAWIAQGLVERASQIEVVHPIELLEQAYTAP